MSVYAIKEAERTRESHAERSRPMGSSARRAEMLVGGGFLVAAFALARFGGVSHFSLLTAAIYVVAVAVAGHVRFDVGAGFTVPTQAVFVPMLFAVPVAVVPLLVPLALAVGMVPRIVRGEVAPSWLLTALGNSWFAIGPALVLVLAHDHTPVGRWGMLPLALAAQFACDFLAGAARDRLYGDLAIRELLAEVRPIYAIDLALSPLGLAVAYATTQGHGQLALLSIAPLFGVLRFFSGERHERLEQLAQLNDAYQGTALLLGDVVEADDSYTGEHCKSVVRLALDVAGELGLDADRRRNVEFAALLHDVGKIAVPKEIINKPGKLDEREWAIIKTHTIEGQRMLERIGGFMNEIGRIVRASHERWDGAGYPDGLSGQKIPIEARIVSACDAFNAMTTTRSYRTAMAFRDAAAELRRCAGTQFDPSVVDGLLKIVARSSGTAINGVRQQHPENGLATSPSILLSSHAAGSAPVPTQTVTESPSESDVQGMLAGHGRLISAGGRENAHAEVIDALAELAVGFAANVQAGQDLEITGEIGHLETVHAIVEAAYRHGARYVDVRLNDPIVQRMRISAGPEDAIGHVPRWEGLRVEDLAEHEGASILVTGPTCPGLLDDLDPRKVALANIGPSAQWRDAEPALNWTIVPAASAGWARQLRPDLPEEEALAALWGDLAHACRLDEPDPAAAWRTRLATLQERAKWLTALRLDTVHLKGPGTDLEIGLIPDARWEFPQMTTPRGVEFLPNLPTEEVYTTPDPTRVNGHVRLTYPVVLGGRLIDDIVLCFQEGRLVGLAGPPETSALREFTARDPGAARLGELALVDADSRIARLGRVFGEILLDENAASHIALGHGYADLMPRTNPGAANTSDHHLDMMFGSPHVEVTGTDRDGHTHTLLHNGQWPSTPRRGTPAEPPRQPASPSPERPAPNAVPRDRPPLQPASQSQTR